MELFYIALCIPILPSILAMIKWSDMDRAQRWFAVLLWLIIVISFAGHIWTAVGYGNNLPFYYIYILVELIILLQIFKLMFGDSIQQRKWLILSLSFLMIWVVNVTYGEGWWVFPNKIRALEAIIIVTIIILWFLKMMRERVILFPYRTFEFWMCTGLLIFFSGNFLLFVFSNYVLNTELEVFMAIWKVNAILNILLYLIYCIALLWVKKTVK